MSRRASRRHRISKKELKKLVKELSNMYERFTISRDDTVEYVKVGDIEIYVINGLPAFYKRKGEDTLLPVLIFLIKRGYDWLPRVVVDRGAARAVGRGADLMVPGIRSLDDFDEGTIVVIVDEASGIPVAVGRALMSSSAIRERLAGERRGKAIENLHYPGDEVWEAAGTV